MHEQAFAARRRMPGFTLIELLVTVALVAILAALAYPNYREFLINTAVTDDTNQLVSALNTARSEAVRRGRNAAVIAYADKWASGWQVVAAAEVAGTPPSIQDTPASPGNTAAACDGYLDNDVDGDSTIPLCLQHRDALADGRRVYAKDGKGDDIAIVVFSPTGALAGTDSVDFSVCRPADYADATKSRRIHVSASGTIETRRDTTDAPAGTCN